MIDGNESEKSWPETIRPMAALFVQRESIWKTLPGVECWDACRDAMSYRGNLPVMAHPMCRLWSRLKHLSTAPETEREQARFAIATVRRCGGVVEHPAGSTLWHDQSLPLGRAVDDYGGWTLNLSQWHFGHEAEKRTWLYIVGCPRERLQPVPFRPGAAAALVSRPFRRSEEQRRILTADERSATPLPFALWLAALVRACWPGFMDSVTMTEECGRTCPACGGAFARLATGRKPRFCSDVCRLRAWRGITARSVSRRHSQPMLDL